MRRIDSLQAWMEHPLSPGKRCVYLLEPRHVTFKHLNYQLNKQREINDQSETETRRERERSTCPIKKWGGSEILNS